MHVNSLYECNTTVCNAWKQSRKRSLNKFQHHGQRHNPAESSSQYNINTDPPPMSGRSFLSYSFSKLFSICVASVSWVLGANIWFTVTSSYSSSSEATVWELRKKRKCNPQVTVRSFFYFCKDVVQQAESICYGFMSSILLLFLEDNSKAFFVIYI